MARRQDIADALRYEIAATGCAPTCQGARKWYRILNPVQYPTDRDYTRAVRYFLRKTGNGALAGTDGRLLAAGYNSLPPRAFALACWEWLGVWAVSAPRPDTVGSPYNASPADVYRAWRRGGLPLARLVARCGGISWGRMPHPRQMARAARALQRDSVQILSYREMVSPSLWSFLGRISPEAQTILLEHLQEKINVMVYRYRQEPNAEDPTEVIILTSRDIDWSVVGPQIKTLQVTRVRASYAAGRRQAAILGLPQRQRMERQVVAALTPQYPRIPVEVACRIVRGESPVSIAAWYDVPLTKKEAHLWLTAGGDPNVIQWLCQHYQVHPYPIRDVAVARWYIACEQDPARREALHRDREILIPGRGMIRTQYIAKIDEISRDDIPHIGAGVDDVFRRAGERVGTAFMIDHEGDYRPLCSIPTLPIYPRCCRWLVSNAELIREGREMSHCVGGYGPYVEDRQSLILALQVRQYRSTLEIDPRTRRVRQHFGPGNTSPAPVLVRLVSRLERKWKQSK